MPSNQTPTPRNRNGRALVRQTAAALLIAGLVMLPGLQTVGALDQDLQPINPLQTTQAKTAKTEAKKAAAKTQAAKKDTAKSSVQASKKAAQEEKSADSKGAKPAVANPKASGAQTAQQPGTGGGKSQRPQGVVGPLNLPLGKPLNPSGNSTVPAPDISEIQSKKLTIWSVNEQGQVQVILDKEGDSPFEPATASKLLTTLLAYDRLSHRLKEKVKLEPSDFEGLAGARVVGFAPGEEVPIVDLFYGCVLESGGDAAQALARLAYGSEAEFVQAMRAQAAALGLKNSQFSNSTGLSAEGDQTTTNDLARIMALCASRPQLARMMMTADYTSTKTEEHPDGIRMQSILFADVAQSRAADPNKKIYIQGGRPGWSPDGGFTLTGFSRVGRKLLVIITAGADSAQGRFSDQVNLYGQLLGKTHELTIFQPGQEMASIPLQNGTVDAIALKNGESPVSLQLPVFLEAGDVEVRKNLPESLEAPVAEGTSLGQVQVVLNDQVLFNQDFAAEKTYRARALSGFTSAVSQFYVQHPAGFVLLFLFLIAILLAAIGFNEYRDRKREAAAQAKAREEAEAARRAEMRAREEARWREQRRTTYTTGEDYQRPSAGPKNWRPY